jgi:hypothetical protein
MSMDLMKGTTTIKADGGMICANYGSEFFKSTGDEPGVAGGVVSSTFIKEATWITFSFNVKLQGKAACRLTDKMFHNHQNTVNCSGELQFPLALVTNDPILYVLCQIHCEVLESKDGKKPSLKAKELGNTKYAGALDNAAKKALGEGAEVALEKSARVAIEKGAMAATKRVPMSADALERRLRNRLLQSAAAKAGKKAASKILLKFIPVVNAVSLAWDVYDIGSTAYEISKAVGDLMKNYDVFRIQPDAMFTSADGKVTIYDHKFGNDSFGHNPGQEELYKKAAGGEPPKEVSKENCGNCAKK